jgi:hypothetical protein
VIASPAQASSFVPDERAEQMAIHYTSRRDLGQALFKWQCAFLVLWLMLVLYVTHRFPTDGAVLMFFLPVAGFCVMGMFPGAGFDFQGLIFSGSFYCCFLAPAIFGSLIEKRIGDLLGLAFSVLSAMIFGFVFFRLMGKAFQRMA